MKINDKAERTRVYFEHEGLLKEKREMNKVHNEKKLRAQNESDKTFENRQRLRLVHEMERGLNKIARQKEIDQHQQFLKMDTRLNII